MPPFIDDLRPLVLCITGVSFILTLVTAFLIRRNIDYWTRRMIPQLNEKPPINQSTRNVVLGGFFWAFLASTLLGAVLSIASASSDPVSQVDNSFTLPTPESALTDSGLSPIRLEMSFPPSLDPCRVDALTVIPNEVDPYQLPPIYPINDWFDRHEFINRAFASISVTNTATEQDVQLANRILTRIVKREDINGAYNAAYTICNEQDIAVFPQIELVPGIEIAGINLGQDQVINLKPWNREVFEVELATSEPGVYEVEMGIEYLDEDQWVQVWSPETLHIYTPESFHRWSAGVVTYWGVCNFVDGDYICEELEYEEPVLVVEEPSAGAENGGASESTDPLNCRPSPPSRLSVGMEASVSYRLSLRLRVREAPGLSSNVITAMARGTEMTVVEGPVCQDGYLWWRIEMDNGIGGWSAEGEPSLYYLEP